VGGVSSCGRSQQLWEESAVVGGDSSCGRSQLPVSIFLTRLKTGSESNCWPVNVKHGLIPAITLDVYNQQHNYILFGICR